MTRSWGGIVFCSLLLVACGSQGKSAAAENSADTLPAALMDSPTASGNQLASNDAEMVGDDTTPSNNGHTQDMTNRTGAAILKEILVQAGTIDGKPIKDFQLRTRCETAFVTADGVVLINWAHVGNYAGHNEGARESFAIDDGNGSHTIAVPAGQQPEPLGDAGARVDGGFSVIADSCQ